MTYKYKIEEFLENLPVKQNKILVIQIPEILGVSYNTFRNYCKIPLNSKKDMPYECVRKLEILFGMQHGELTNTPTVGSHYLELVKRVPVMKLEEAF
ncbi:hypothetical protein AAKU52_003455 [Pedobacter sp. CG_S7]|uniref:hypothetical protein n=1 Tax=Pedobacter sp. CG_S7 TaxID=3143930 RepID=UPI003397B149